MVELIADDMTATQAQEPADSSLPKALTIIPNAAMAQDRRDQAAAAWADAQMKNVADMWAAAQHQQLGQILSSVQPAAADVRSQLADIAKGYGGDDYARVIRATLETEGWQPGQARGDSGMSSGPLQLYRKGMLPAFAQYLGVDPDTAAQISEGRPDVAVDWATRPGGYLWNAYQDGKAKGLSGADLATYVQEYGQRSVSPERAGQNYLALAGGAQPQGEGQPQAQQQGAGLAEGSGRLLAGAGDALGDVGQAVGGALGNVGQTIGDLAGKAGQGAGYLARNIGQGVGDIAQAALSPGSALQNAADLAGKGLQTAQDVGNVIAGQSGATIADTAQRLNLSQDVRAPGSNPGAEAQLANMIAARDRYLQDSIARYQQMGLPADQAQALAQQDASQRYDSAIADMQYVAAHPALPAGAPQSSEALLGSGDWNKAVASGRQYAEQNPVGSTVAGFLSPASVPDRLLEGLQAAHGIGDLGMGAALAVGGLKSTKPADMLAKAASTPLPEGAQAIGLTAEQQAARLRLDKFPEWAQDTIQQAAQDVGWATGQRRGVIPTAVSEQMADQLADPQTGRTVEQWIAQSKAGKTYNTEELRALRNAILAQAQKVNDASTALDAATKSGDVTDRMIADAFTEGQRLQALTTIFEGGRAEWGRAGLAFQSTARNVASPAENMARIYRKVGGRDNALAAVQQYQQLVQDGASPVQMANFWSKVDKPPVGAKDWFNLVRYNSMMSGPRTVEINLVGNALEAPWRLARDTLASTLRGRPQDMAPELAGVWAGAQRGVRPFLETLTQGITTEQALAGDVPSSVSARVSNPVLKAGATALEMPGRLNQAVDQWSKQIGYSMGLGRQAAITASREGLKGQVWQQRVADLMANPSDGMMKAADGIADRMTFKGDMGALGNGLTGLQQVPYIGNILIPFLRTVYHITARGIDRSPLGLIGTGADVFRTGGRYVTGQEIPKGAAPFGERIGDNLMGSAVGLGLVGYAMGGNISAAGPDTPAKRALLQSTGWMPYSIKVGDKWVSYSNWGPLAVPFAMAASLAESNLYAKPGTDTTGKAMDFFSRMGQLATEQTYLQGVGAAIKAIQQPDQYGTSWLTGFMNSLVPFGSAINTLGQATDPYQRAPEKASLVGLTENARQSLLSRFPGLREQVPAAQTSLGEPKLNMATGPAAFQPFRVGAGQEDPVERALLDAGVDVAAVPSHFRNVPLTPAEQRQFQVIAGQRIHEVLPQIISDPAYQSAAPDARKKVLQRIVDSARQVAGATILQGLGGAGLEQRLANP